MPSSSGATETLNSTAAELKAPPPFGLQVHVFTMGQADSMLIIGPKPEQRSLLIDLGETRGGDRKSHLRIAQRIEELTGRRGVDYFLVSHFHADHLGSPGKGKGKPSGMLALMMDSSDGFSIGTWIDRGDDDRFAARTRSHEAVIQGINGWIQAGRVGKRLPAEPGSSGIFLGAGVEVEILAAGGKRGDNASALERVESASPGIYERAPASENDFSIALLIRRGDFELFTAGDLTGAAWPGPEQDYPNYTERRFGSKGSTYTNVESFLVEDWQQQGREMDVEIYRANHHGSAHSSSAPLLDALDPEFIIYSTGGQYGHPAREVVERGAQTAKQLITHAASLSSWPSGMPVELAQVVGEVNINVSMDGKEYTILGRRQPCFDEQAEREDRDQHVQ
ncbi:MAG: hypothetical protein CMP23_03255 [Rickettsiales bacterium]|nr:hypothetical protein [Rickettsiales bacterium]